MFIISRAPIEWCIGELWTFSIVAYSITSIKHNTNTDIHIYKHYNNNNIIIIID